MDVHINTELPGLRTTPNPNYKVSCLHDDAASSTHFFEHKKELWAKFTYLESAKQKKTGKRCEICSRLTVRRSERRQ